MRYYVLLGLVLCHAAVFGQSVADSLIRDGNYTAVLEWIERQPTSTSIELKQTRARALIGLGRFGEAGALLNDLLRDTSSDSPVYPDLLNLRGFLNMNTGRNDAAREDFTAALKGYAAANFTVHPSVASCHSNLGTLYVNTGKYQQAEDQFSQSLNIRVRLYGASHPEVAAALNDLGLVYAQTDPGKALTYYGNARDWYASYYGKDHPKIAITSTNLGILHKGREDFSKAIQSFEEALRIWQRVFPDGHPNQALVLSYLAQTYFSLGNTVKARSLFREALKQYRSAYGERHPDLSATYNQLATLYIKEKSYDSALVILQQALVANTKSFSIQDLNVNPASQDHFNPYVMLYTHQLKAQVLETRYYAHTLRLEDLRRAVRSIAICDTLINSIRRQSPEETDKIRLGTIVHEVFEDGVRLCHAIGELSVHSGPWEEQAFHYAEKSKAAVLLESIAEASARSYAGLPDSLLESERNLKAKLQVATRRLAELAGREEEAGVRSELFRLKQEQTQFTEYLSKMYPRYFNLKYQESVPSVSELQDRIGPKEAVVSYFVAEKNPVLYIFTLTKKHFKVDVRTINGDLNRLINGFYNSVKLGNHTTYTKSAPQLSALLKPDLPARVKDVIVIPSGALSKIPLEALPLHKRDKSKAFASSYWINRWAIAYDFSTALMVSPSEAVTETNQRILLCAPVRFSPERRLSELPGTQSEVDSIARLFPHGQTVLIGAAASEEAFRNSDLKQYRYIHLATHGLADEGAPELSRIFLRETENADGDLFTGEIYNLNLKADLVTLSACQTGLGKVHRGEGMMGLSRALRYAGAEKVVVSYWSVSDEATARLMVNFYRNFTTTKASGTPDYFSALAEAKRSMIADKTFKDPFYWAAFVVLGY